MRKYENLDSLLRGSETAKIFFASLPDYVQGAVMKSSSSIRTEDELHSTAVSATQENVMNTENAVDALNQSSRLINTSVNEVTEIIWKLNPQFRQPWNGYPSCRCSGYSYHL